MSEGRTLQDRRTIPQRRNTFSEIHDHFARRVRILQEQYDALEERLNHVKGLVEQHKDRHETALRDLNVTDTNVANLFKIAQEIRKSLKEFDYLIFKSHDQHFDLKNIIELVQTSVETRIELIKTVFTNLQKRKQISNKLEIELIPIASKKHKNESVLKSQHK